MNRLDKDFLRVIIITMLGMLLISCTPECDETVFVTNDDGTTSVECVIYNNN